MDSITLLTADHNRVRGLFARFDDAQEDDDHDTVDALSDEIAHELEVHTTIEEEIFYPWARALSAEIAELIDEGVEEHHLVKILIEELRSIPAGDDEWVAKMTVLIENVEHHAEEEETELFPAVRSASSAGDRQAVAEQMEARKAELGAPVLADKIDLTVAELRALATEQAIPGRSMMKHDELAATVSPG